ncbi:hypothetical protein EI94DRAFT_1155143 [Lactarius quietus]|nr:hypothetical protein EI94DRAFT_1155143 [Lactarius quietus]
MQSKSSLFVRKILPAPFTINSGDGDDDRIGGFTDFAMSALEASLTILKDASTLASKVPYIAPIAGIILEALKMRDEVKQLKGEWGVVMQRLGKVGSILVDVGEWYQANDLREDDLPSDLRNVLKSLQIDLDGIQDVLEQCAKVKGIRRVLSRTDILEKVKQYDARLTNTIQVFNARVALGSRLAQIVQDRKVNTLGPTAVSHAGSESLAPTPSVPQMFFVRDTELSEVIEMIFTDIGSRPARIAILGPSGYGKTALANAALTHPRVRDHFGDARYMVSCESLGSSEALLIELAKAVGVLKAGSDSLWSRIHASLITKEGIICFDDFDSPWDEPCDIKASAEDLLSRIMELRHVTIIITMRGTKMSTRTQWTQPTLAPLDSDAVCVLPVDSVMSRIKMALDILKEAGSLASKVPCISPISGMLLHAIQMHAVGVP